MKTLNLRFSEHEFKKLKSAYGLSETTSWEKWLIEVADTILEDYKYD